MIRDADATLDRQGESYTAYAKAPSLDGWLAALDEILKTKSPPSDFENVDCETWYLVRVASVLLIALADGLSGQPKEIARVHLLPTVNASLRADEDD